MTESSADQPSADQQRILVVDDEAYLTDLLSTSLQFQGFEVAIAGNGFDALSKVGSFDPDLVLLDVLMPDIDGIEVCRRLRAAGNQVPVIFLTARDTKADLLSAPILEYADVAMDEASYVVTRGDREIDLSPTEWRLLRYLLTNAERVLSKQQILGYVWHYDFGGEEGSVETYISYLRKKLDDNTEPLIHTIRGVGYTLRSRQR